jgi:hypothetical protein
MNNINWTLEHKRFEAVAYPATQKAAKRAFWNFPENRRSDAVQECHAKMWDQWSRLRLKGKNPETMVGCLIKYALLWVRYDRKLGGRARTPDVYDYRAGFSQQFLSDQGVASPSERSDAENPWIDFNVQSGDNPADLAAALEETGVSLAQWCDC